MSNDPYAELDVVPPVTEPDDPNRLTWEDVRDGWLQPESTL